MGSSSRKRQTLAKMTRELAVRERRLRKQQKREEKRLAADGRSGEGEAVDGTPGSPADDESAG